MPRKGHRTASRQAQLSQKKRRSKGGRPQAFDPGPGEASIATAAEEPAVETESAPQRAKPAVATRRSTSGPQPARRSRQRTSVEYAPTTYRYMGAELRQIGMITTLIVAILIVLTFVLRG